MSQIDNKDNNNIIQLIGNLSSQSTESSNIILRAISQGISSGLSQGIALGNISFSLQDVITLATVFKPKDDIALRLIDGLMPKNYNTDQENASLPVIDTNEDTTVKAFANPDSLATSHYSSGLPSSVHIFDVTDEKSRAYEHTVSLRVSRNADDDNAESSSISTVSGGETNESTSSSTKNSSRKRLFQYMSDTESSNEANSKNRMRFESSHHFPQNAIESLSELSTYVSQSSNSLPEAVVMAHKKVSKSNGK